MQSESEVEAGSFATMRPPSLIKRFGEVQEVGNLVINGSLQQTSAATGAALRVDGGFVRAIV